LAKGLIQRVENGDSIMDSIDHRRRLHDI
jgi:hypothetical protein